MPYTEPRLALTRFDTASPPTLRSGCLFPSSNPFGVENTTGIDPIPRCTYLVPEKQEVESNRAFGCECPGERSSSHTAAAWNPSPGHVQALRSTPSPVGARVERVSIRYAGWIDKYTTSFRYYRPSAQTACTHQTGPVPGTKQSVWSPCLAVDLVSWPRFAITNANGAL